jgi:hypothetical protein
MAFTKQGGNIEQALVTGGLSPMAANAIMYAIANCAQPLEHRGPFTINYVPQQVRLQTPERAKYTYEKFNFQTSEGERRSVKFASPNPDGPFDGPLDPNFPTDGCDLTTVCDRLDGIDSQLAQVYGALGELGATVLRMQAYILGLEQRLKALEDLLRNTTDCPQAGETP